MPRIVQDAHDKIVWSLTETSGPYKNIGNLLQNDSSTDLVITNSMTRTSNGFFGNSPLIPGTSDFPTGSSATRNYAAGAKIVTIGPPITVSCWINLKSYTGSNNQQIFCKEYRDSTITSSWTNPFYAIALTVLTTSGGQVWEASVALSSSSRAILTVSDFPIPIGQWSHIGITHDGTDIRAYLNGCQCIYYSSGTQFNSVAASTISYTDGTNGFGYWKFGAVTATGSSNKEEPNMQIQDVRIANIARPLSYFKFIFKNGLTPSFLVNGTQYYKLRTYDTSCVTPTPVVWVDTQVSLANAPIFPCGGPYTTPEVLDTWII